MSKIMTTCHTKLPASLLKIPPGTGVVASGEFSIMERVKQWHLMN